MHARTNSDQDEALLIQAAGKGDLEAFNQLVLKYQSLAYHHASFLLGDTALAEDAAQESFMKAFQNIHAFRGGSFRSWLLRILTNTGYDLLRKRNRQRSVSLYPQDETGDEIESTDWLVDPGMPAHERVEQKELSAVLIKALNELPECYRNVMILVDIYEMDYLEAARVLDIPLGTVKSRIARARLQLKERLQGSVLLSSPLESSLSEHTASILLGRRH
jgi:RNA polymerase sigma-70 factor, ECF subfamily